MAGDRDNDPELLELDLTYRSALGPLHIDFTDRADCIESKAGSPLRVFLPSPEDLALTKLDRLTEADIQDILALMQVDGASWDRLIQMVQDVEKYFIGQPGSLTNKLNYLINHRRGLVT